MDRIEDASAEIQDMRLVISLEGAGRVLDSKV